jgi:hypothetical protein
MSRRSKIWVIAVVVVAGWYSLGRTQACYAGVTEVREEWGYKARMWQGRVDRALDVDARLRAIERRVTELEKEQEALELEVDVDRMEEFFEAITDPDIENFEPYERKEP